MANHWNHHRKHPTLESIPSIHINHSGVADECREAFKGHNLQPGYIVTCTTDRGVKIPVHATACNYDGFRFWFICSGCKNNRLILRYLEKEKRYFCNDCLNGVHASSQMSKSDRVTKATWKRLKKYGLDDFFSGLDRLDMWAKPKGMHKQTWQRIVEKHNSTMMKDRMHKKYFAEIERNIQDIKEWRANNPR